MFKPFNSRKHTCSMMLFPYNHFSYDPMGFYTSSHEFLHGHLHKIHIDHFFVIHGFFFPVGYMYAFDPSSQCTKHTCKIKPVYIWVGFKLACMSARRQAFMCAVLKPEWCSLQWLTVHWKKRATLQCCLEQRIDWCVRFCVKRLKKTFWLVITKLVFMKTRSFRTSLPFFSVFVCVLSTPNKSGFKYILSLFLALSLMRASVLINWTLNSKPCLVM